MAKQQVVVPDIGGAEDAEVVELLVAVGDEVEDTYIAVVAAKQTHQGATGEATPTRDQHAPHGRTIRRTSV